MFWCISYHLDPFGTVRLPYETQGKTGRTSAKVRATKSSRIFFMTNAPDPPHLTLNSCFGAFCTVLVHLQPFGCLAKLEAKHSELLQKFVPQSRVGIFRNESTRSTPCDPKLMFWCVSYHLDAFVTVRLPYETRCKTGRTSAKVRATKSSRIVFATNAPNPPYWTLNSCFGAFCTVLVHLQPFGCLAKLGVKRFELVQKFVPRCRVRILRNRRTRSTPLDPKLLFCTIWVHLGPLSCLTKLGAKRSELVQKFVPRSRIEVYSR